MPVALETFLSQLSDSGILSDQKLRVATHKKSEHQDGESLAKDMIKSGHLTKYQAEQILSGKGKNLCMGQYVLLEKLGAGGMGQVFKAYHPGMERLVAIKVILAKGNTDAETVKRFEREIKAAAKLAHPNIITVYDAGNADGRHFMVMELVKGQDLSEIISQKGQFDTSDTIDYIIQAAKGLKFAHANGVIHRDIKPGNLILDSDGVLKIVDMGLAKIHSKENDETLSMLTGNAAIMGTVDFMSPEQSLSTKNVDERADIYSLGATLYYMLTGNVMYPGKTAMVKLMAHRKSLIPSLRASRPDISENLDAIYTKMVAKDLNDRYQNMSELISDLELVANGFAPIIKPKEMVTTNSLQDDFGGFQIKVKGTNLKLGKSTINFKGLLANKKLLGIIGGTLVGALLVIFFFMIGIFGGVKKEEFKKQNQISSGNKTLDTKSNVTTIPKENKSTSIIAETKSGQSVFLISPFSESMAKETQSTLAKSLNMPAEEKVHLGNGVSLDMVLIPAGKFLMGSSTTEVGRKNDETQHEVTLTKPYHIGKYEVTQEQWEGIMGNNPSSRTKGKRLPVTDVSWNDCQDFIKKLNGKTKGGYRLPTEAEWEYACRVGTRTSYSFGDSITTSDGNIGGSSTKIVGNYKPNAFGLYDMYGNVWERCEDWGVDYPLDSVTDPKGPITGERRVMRGGSFAHGNSEVRSSTRYFNLPTDRYNDCGFRLAKTVDFKTVIAPTEPRHDLAAVMPATVNLLVSPFSEAKANEVQKTVAKSLIKEVEEKADFGKGIKLELVLIPAGKFNMGSPESENGRLKNETQHEVTLTKPYYIGKYEVTQEQWESVMGSNPSSNNKGAKLPVTNVSWEDCREFIKKLNTKTNGDYRLPTEAEWEYTCRAGTTTAYSFGSSLTKSDANIDGSSIKTVGSYRPNAFGLYDMHGNVWEWCEDWLGDYPAEAVTDPKGPVKGTNRMLRGGAFTNSVSEARSSFRINNILPSSWHINVGFRLAKTVDFKTVIAPTEPRHDLAAVMPATVNLLVSPFSEAKAREVQKEVAKSLKMEVEEKVNLGNGVSLDMVLIPAGKFKMGSPAAEPDQQSNEIQHEVALTNPFYLGKYEVSQEQWESVMGNNPSSKMKGAKFPVTDVSWNDCQEFIKKLNKKTNGGYRLPTEAEWEYACRAGTTTAYSIGDKLTESDANILDITSIKGGTGIKKVGSYKPNGFGLYDMHGNVWEWCADWYGDYPAGPAIDPKGPVTGSVRVLRGGSFNFNVSTSRSYCRGYDDAPAFRFNDVYGFRLARAP